MNETNQSGVTVDEANSGKPMLTWPGPTPENTDEIEKATTAERQRCAHIAYQYYIDKDGKGDGAEIAKLIDPPPYKCYQCGQMKNFSGEFCDDCTEANNDERENVEY